MWPASACPRSPIRTCSGCLSPASSIAGADSGGRADDDSAEDAEPLKRLAARCGWCLLRAPCSQPVQRTPSSTRATVVHLPLEQMGELRRAVSEARRVRERGRPATSERGASGVLQTRPCEQGPQPLREGAPRPGRSCPCVAVASPQRLSCMAFSHFRFRLQRRSICVPPLPTPWSAI